MSLESLLRKNKEWPKYLILVLTFVTGLIHLHLAFLVGPNMLGFSFALAALGFAVAFLMIAFGILSNLAYIGLVFSTALQILLWYRINLPDLSLLILEQEPLLDFIDKVSQILILIFSLTVLKINGFNEIKNNLENILESSLSG